MPNLSYSPASSPSPVAFPEIIFSSPLIRVPKAIFDRSTISIALILVISSTIASCLVFHLVISSRKSRHLRKFNSLWTVRLVLVGFAFLWAINETLSSPFIRRNFLPRLTLKQQINICKLNTVLSLGLLEPGFLVALLFLIKVSIEERRSPSRMWAVVASVLVLCCPIALAQAMVVYFLHSREWRLPTFMNGSYTIAMDIFGQETAFCTYPFLSSMVFIAFTVAYSVAFLLSCWHVMKFAINKGIRRRINFMVVTLMVVLPLQILCLSLSWLWMPDDVVYGCLGMVMCLCVAWCMVVGEVIFVIKPIRDSLAEGGQYVVEENGSTTNL